MLPSHSEGSKRIQYDLNDEFLSFTTCSRAESHVPSSGVPSEKREEIKTYMKRGAGVSGTLIIINWSVADTKCDRGAPRVG